MEDNEFEEVTIISHTDRPHRVFSEKSIEKLKEQISLEIVKEISGTEDKTYSDDPRLAPGLRELEKLKQDHFGEGEGKIPWENLEIHFISRVAGESGQYLLGAQTQCILSNGESSPVVRQQENVTRFLLPWGDLILMSSECREVVGYSRNNFEERWRSINNVWTVSSHRVCSTTNKVYYMSSCQGFLLAIDRDMNEECIYFKDD